MRVRIPCRRYVGETATHVMPPIGTVAPPGSVIFMAQLPLTPTTRRAAVS